MDGVLDASHLALRPGDDLMRLFALGERTHLIGAGLAIVLNLVVEIYQIANLPPSQVACRLAEVGAHRADARALLAFEQWAVTCLECHHPFLPACLVAVPASISR